MGFDVGLLNLAWVKCRVNKDTNTITEILMADRVDLFALPHKKVKRVDCKLHHSRQIFDMMNHLIQEYQDDWQDVDRVLIEQQPPTGLVHIEQFLFGHFRDIVTMVYPQTWQKHFNIGHLEYAERKTWATEYAKPWLQDTEAWQHNPTRQHDMSDALCIILYHLATLQKQNVVVGKHAKMLSHNSDWEKYKYHTKTVVTLTSFLQRQPIPPDDTQILTHDNK
jgi:hypothetical protein